jgi:hypothetical protein
MGNLIANYSKKKDNKALCCNKRILLLFIKSLSKFKNSSLNISFALVTFAENIDQ